MNIQVYSALINLVGEETARMFADHCDDVNRAIQELGLVSRSVGYNPLARYAHFQERIAASRWLNKTEEAEWKNIRSSIVKFAGMVNDKPESQPVPIKQTLRKVQGGVVIEKSVDASELARRNLAKFHGETHKKSHVSGG